MSIEFVLVQEFKKKILSKMRPGERLSKSQIGYGLNISPYEVQMLIKQLKIELYQNKIGLTQCDFDIIRHKTKKLNTEFIVKK